MVVYPNVGCITSTIPELGPLINVVVVYNFPDNNVFVVYPRVGRTISTVPVDPPAVGRMVVVVKIDPDATVFVL